jgi:hypothetical protein
LELNSFFGIPKHSAGAITILMSFRGKTVPKNTATPRLFPVLSKPLFMALFFVMALTAGAVITRGQGKETPDTQRQDARSARQANFLLPDHIGERWKAVGPVRTLDPRNANELADSDAITEYGAERILSRVYTDGKSKTTVELFEMKFVSGAYGLVTFNRGRIPQGAREISEGRYAVRLTTSPQDNSLQGGQEEKALFESLKPNLKGGEGQLPSLPLHLPAAGKIAGSEKYVIGPAALAKLKYFGDLKDVIDFGSGVEIAAGDYQNGAGQLSLLILEYPAPQFATDGLAKFQSYFNALPQAEKDRRILKRVGNYIVEAINIQDLPAAQNLVGQVKYETKVYWAGKKFTDIPLEFRPTDPVAVDEAVRTTQVLVRSFYWMGAMLLSAIFLGLIAGGVFFGWTVYRRRKLGLDALFSDAGGSIRLNLDDYLLSGDSEVKQIDDGGKK